MVAGYSSFFKQLFKPKTYKGHTTTEVFYNWLEEDLLPSLKIKSKETDILDFVLILDNASFHKSKKIKKLVERYGFKILYLAPYSPDYNPIEHQWHTLKLYLAKMRSQTEHFLDDLKYVLWLMSSPQV